MISNIRISRFSIGMLARIAVTATAAFLPGLAFSAPAENRLVILDARRPDFFIQSTFSQKAQDQAIKQLRQVMINSAGFDPLSHEFKETIRVPVKLDPKMPHPIKDMVERILKLRFNAAEMQIEVHGLKIESPSASIRLDDLKLRPRGLQFIARLRLQQTTARAEKIVIRFREDESLGAASKGALRNSFVNDLTVEVLQPTLKAERLDSLASDVLIQTETQADGSTKIGLDGGVFKLYEKLSAEQLMSELNLEVAQINVLGADGNQGFGIQAGSAYLPARDDGPLKAVMKRKANIADLMLTPLVKELRAAPTRIFGTDAPSLVIPRVLEEELPCFGKTGLRVMRYGMIGDDQIQIALGLEHPSYEATTHGLHYFDQASNAVYDQIDHLKSSIVMGVGYRAMSWALTRSIRECFKDKLPKHLSLGREGAVVRLDEIGNGAGVVALHANFQPNRFLGTVLGKRIVEFPVKVSPRLNFQPGADQVTQLTLDLSEADLSESVLRNGYHNIPSNLGQLRLKRLVMKQVQGQLKKGLKNVQLNLPLPFARGDDLKFAELRADGFGNLNLNLKLNPDVHPEVEDFWTIFAELVKPFFSRKAAEKAIEKKGAVDLVSPNHRG